MEDKLKGLGNKAKGTAKEAWGDATNDARSKAEGKADQLKGDLQHSVGKAKDKFNH